MSNELTTIWMFSSKDVEHLFYEDTIKDCFFQKENTFQYDVFNEEFKENWFTLKNFYFDIIKFKEKKKRINCLQKIKYSAKLYDPFIYDSVLSELTKSRREDSGGMINKVFGLKLNNQSIKDCRVFYTRCFPNKNKYCVDFHNHFENEGFKFNLSNYWVLAYMYTTANLIEIDVKNILFNFVFHDEDFGIEKTNGNINFEPTKFPLIEHLFNEGSCTLHFGKTYAYTHEKSRRCYRDLICNSNFFDNIKNNEEAIEAITLFFDRATPRMKLFEELKSGKEIKSQKDCLNKEI